MTPGGATDSPTLSVGDRVSIYEVGPRDGLQNEAAVLPLAAKVELVERLVAAGVRALEVTSMVRPDRVPQLADAEELLRALSLPSDIRVVVLAPNLHGVRRAVEMGVGEIAIFASATETFSRRNLNCSIDESFARFEPVVETARANGIDVRAYVSMCFGDPWEGNVSRSQVVGVARRLMDLGATELAVGDTIGVATATEVVHMLDDLDAVGIPPTQVAIHFHDTYGQALANTMAALQRGVRTIDSSVGGLGGCPFAQSASGNLATEDLLWQLHGNGIQTGIDLDALVDTSTWLAGELGHPSPSRVVQALSGSRRR